MAAQPTGPPARWRRAFAGANQSHADLDFRRKSLQTVSAVKRHSHAPFSGRSDVVSPLHVAIQFADGERCVIGRNGQSERHQP